jgi:hypothetical protein
MMMLTLTVQETLRPVDVYAIAKFCRPQRRSKWGPHHVVMRYLRTKYSRPEWLQTKGISEWMDVRTS